MRNAFSGYSYQKQVTLLLLTIMDVERVISKIEIEAKTNDNFDDLIISTKSESFHFQIKDFDDVSVEDLLIENDKIFIKGKPHKLSSKHNVIFFKKILIKPNEKTLEFSSYRLSSKVSIVSLSRTQIDSKITNLLGSNFQRKNEIDCFFNSILDNRIWEIPRESLPQLKVFITELQEKSVTISHKLLEFETLLLIEGKPGVGKSHFVNTLTKEYKNHILYRFWIGNQDRDYKERLKFENFIRDLNTKLFYDQKSRAHQFLFDKFKKEEKTLIIDGLDHIENYNKPEFENYINFIESAKNYCKVIVLSRPLTKELSWKKHTLENWNLKQTEKVLKTLFHISEYPIVDGIFRISQGYPIVVKYLAEHYKLHKSIPNVEQVNSIDTYYQDIIANEKGKQSLSLFLCANSYIMESEIELFIGNEKHYVLEFIKEHPYLFDIKLNRISLFHDSFNTFLRKQVDFTHTSQKVSNIVSNSIMQFEHRFLSRFALFNLPIELRKKVLTRYASINSFEKILKHVIDYESIITFYNQLRETIADIPYSELSVRNYYDLSLIFNLVSREHLSTINTFYFTYVESLISNGITNEDITSTEYLFGMYYYVKTKNPTLLLNKTANDHFDVEHFHRQLENDIEEEENYIYKHSKKLNKKAVEKALSDRINFKDYLTHIIENIYIHNSNIKGYEILKTCFVEYLNGNTNKAIYSLERFLTKYNTPEYYSRWILKDVFNNLLSYGYKVDNGNNEYHDLSLKALIEKHADLGSFNLRDKIHNYIRLAFLENREIDIKSIYLYWPKYYQRRDYSLFSLPIALKILHDERLISLHECVKLIHEIQEVSEKGYRYLLASFIELYPPSKIISFLEKNFPIEELRVSWFELPTKYINRISEQTYNFAENRLIQYHRNSPIPLDEIENVLWSNKFENLEFTLNFFKMRISFKENQKRTIQRIKQSRIRFPEVKEQDDHSEYRQSSKQKYENGVLPFEDKKFIKKQRLQPYEVAKYANDNSASLPEIDIFKIYTTGQINRNFKRILYNSMISKTKSINYYFSLYFHPGNVLAMIKLYRNDKDFKVATRSFAKFMNLSMYKLKMK